jgi:hypothetical protein
VDYIQRVSPSSACRPGHRGTPPRYKEPLYTGLCGGAKHFLSSTAPSCCHCLASIRTVLIPSLISSQTKVVVEYAGAIVQVQLYRLLIESRSIRILDRACRVQSGNRRAFPSGRHLAKNFPSHLSSNFHLVASARCGLSRYIRMVSCVIT